jgi:hypothetical protein
MASHRKRIQAKKFAKAWQDEQRVEEVRRQLESKKVKPFQYRIPRNVYERENLRPSWMQGSGVCKNPGDRSVDGSRCGRRPTKVWESKHGGLPNYPV